MAALHKVELAKADRFELLDTFMEHETDSMQTTTEEDQVRIQITK